MSCLTAGDVIVLKTYKNLYEFEKDEWVCELCPNDVLFIIDVIDIEKKWCRVLTANGYVGHVCVSSKRNYVKVES